MKDAKKSDDNLLLKVEHLEKRFPIRSGILGREHAAVHAVRGVSLEVERGETLGLVGESGCGKSTLALMLLRLVEPDAGRILFDNQDITHMSQRHLKGIRRRLQVVFQDPYASLNPRMTAADIVAEPLTVHRTCPRSERHDRAIELLRMVGLPAEVGNRYPHEFSGGQRQRIGIARAIALTPEFIIADEPVSALDLSIRGEILNLLCDLRDRFNLAYLFIAHDLKVVEQISHRVMVMYLGKVMERFPADRIASARHPYTQALVSAVPVPDPLVRRQRVVLTGDVPSPLSPPAGCAFVTRCPYARDICSTQEPTLVEYQPGFAAACHFIGDMANRRVAALSPAFRE